MIKLVIIAVLLILYLIVMTPVMGIMYLIDRKWPHAGQLAMQRITQAGLWIGWKVAGARVTTIGLENIPEDKPVLFVGNHLGGFDIVISYSQMKTRTGFIAKKSFEKYPFFSWNMKLLKCLFIDRENLREGVKTILKAVELAKDGTSYFIFPEGTRNKSGDELSLGDFHDGSFKIAQRAGIPVIPVAFSGTNKIFETQAPKIRSADVVVRYGAPISFDDLDKEAKKHPGKYFREIIIDMLKENHELMQA